MARQFRGGTEFLFGRDLSSVILSATGVPAAFSAYNETRRQRDVLVVSSDSQTVDSLDLTVHLSKQRKSERDDAFNEAERQFELEARQLFVNDLNVEISDHGSVRMPPQGDNRIRIARGDTVDLGMKLLTFQGVHMFLDPDEQLTMTEFRVQRGTSLGASLNMGEELEISISHMPSILDLDLDWKIGILDGTPWLKAAVAPSEHVPELTARIGSSADGGWKVRLVGVPGGVTTGVLSQLSAAFLLRADVPVGSLLGGMEVTRYTFGGYGLQWSTGGTGAFMAEGDLDGSLRHAEHPRFFDVRAPVGTKQVSFHIVGKDNELVFRAPFLQNGEATTLLKVVLAAEAAQAAAPKVAEKGCEFATEGTSVSRVAFFVATHWFNVPRDVCEEWWSE